MPGRSGVDTDIHPSDAAICGIGDTCDEGWPRSQRITIQWQVDARSGLDVRRACPAALLPVASVAARPQGKAGQPLAVLHTIEPWHEQPRREPMRNRKLLTIDLIDDQGARI